MHELEIFFVQVQLVLPIPDVLMNDFDWKSFSDPPGRCLNNYYALNHPAKVFSVMSFLQKFSSLMDAFLRSLGVLCIRFVFRLKYRMN